MPETDHWGVAVHEAGYAVAAHALGRSIVRVSIVPKDDSLGHVRHRRKGERWVEKLEEADYEGCHGELIDARLRRSVEIEIMVSLAGGLAEELATGREAHEVGGGFWKLTGDEAKAFEAKTGHQTEFLIAGGDLNYALDLASKVSGGDEEASAYLQWLEQRTRNLLAFDIWWAGIQGLARGLLVESTMSGRRCLEVIEEAIEAHVVGLASSRSARRSNG